MLDSQGGALCIGENGLISLAGWVGLGFIENSAG